MMQGKTLTTSKSFSFFLADYFTKIVSEKKGGIEAMDDYQWFHYFGWREFV